MLDNIPYVLCIVGPTASGKTDFSLLLAKKLAIEVINIDIGQFYKPLSIGTAKPDWQNMPVPHHLFDILSEPKDLNTFDYRELVLKTVKKIHKKGKFPVLVGGSLFYVQSLFFPQKNLIQKKKYIPKKDEDLWIKLHEVDPERAETLHHHDTYRIKRALDIWMQTGQKASTYKPVFDPPFHARILFLDMPREKLFERINERTNVMIKNGWIDEAKKIKPSWQMFLQRKKLIGYSEIFSWIESGENQEQLVELVKSIQKKTRNYAKRQVTFWKKFRNLLLESQSESKILCNAQAIKIDNIDSNEILQQIKNDLQKISNERR